jgi:hypothetical protein
MGVILLGILLGTSGDCDHPIRLWLWVQFAIAVGYAVLFIVVVGISLSVKEDPDKLQRVGYCAASFQGLIGLFSFVWFIIGNVWLYSSDDCASDWTAGFVITLIILIFGYIAIAIVCCCCCCLICGVGVLGMAAASSEPSGHSESEPLRGNAGQA